MTAADVATVLAGGAGQLLTAIPGALWVIIQGLGCITLAAIIVVAMVWAKVCWDDRRFRKRAAPMAEPKAVIGQVPDAIRDKLLKFACGPCGDEPGTRTCICPANCGRPRCQGAHVHADLSGELLRITRDGRRG